METPSGAAVDTQALFTETGEWKLQVQYDDALTEVIYFDVKTPIGGS